MARERVKDDLLKGTHRPQEKGVGSFDGERVKSERQILKKTWCRDDGHADRRHVYSTLLTPSLLIVLFVQVTLVSSCVLISPRHCRCLNVSILRQLEMIVDSLFDHRFQLALLLRMGADRRRAGAEALAGC